MAGSGESAGTNSTPSRESHWVKGVRSITRAPAGNALELRDIGVDGCHGGAGGVDQIDDPGARPNDDLQLERLLAHPLA